MRNFGERLRGKDYFKSNIIVFILIITIIVVSGEHLSKTFCTFH